MSTLITKELKDFFSNIFGVVSLAVLLCLSFLFLWIFQDSSYLNYGLAEYDLYFQFVSYLLLMVVPAFATGFVTSEYRFRTHELLATLNLSWKKVVLSKFIAALCVVALLLLLTSVNVYVLNELKLQDNATNYTQIFTGFAGLLGVAAVYIAISFFISSIVENATASFLISVVLCFMIFLGLRLLSENISLGNNWGLYLEQWSLSYHIDEIGRGVLRLSSIFFLVGLSFWFLCATIFNLSNKEV